MSVVKFTVRLFDTTALAADGSNIPRRSCEQYLASSDYQTIIQNKLAIGGQSHKDRRLKPELKGLIGMDDQVLINDNALFYITRLYFKPGDNFLYADAETFDPELFDGKRKENIQNLIGLFQSGVRMPCSVVIQALWSKRGTAEKIIRIKGFDITQNPSFKGAGVYGEVQVFSETIEDESNVEYSKTFSIAEDLTLETRSFSFVSEINVDTANEIEPISFSKLLNAYPEQSTFSYIEVVAMYGQGSEQEMLVREYQGQPIQRTQLYQGDVREPSNPELKKYYDMIVNSGYDGDPGELKYLFNGNRESLMNIITSVPDSDPDKVQLVTPRILQFFRTIPNSQKEFSTNPSSVQDRVTTQQQPRFTKFSRTIKSYQQYWNTRKLTDEQKYKCKILFTQDINILLKDVLHELYQGQTLNSLYALGQYDKPIKDSGIRLSHTYRKVLISNKIMGFVPKGIYGEWIVDIKDFYNALMKYTFGEDLKDLGIDLTDLIR